MSKITVMEVLATLTTQEEIMDLMRRSATADNGVPAGLEDTFSLGYLASYVAALHTAAATPAPPVPLTDAEVDELLVNVSIARLERLVETRLQQVTVAGELGTCIGCEADEVVLENQLCQYCRALPPGILAGDHVCRGLPGEPCAICGRPDNDPNKFYGGDS